MNKGFERKHNLFKIIDALQRQGAMTQAQLKERCGLLASTVSYAVRDLRKFGFISDLGQAPSLGRAGKPGHLIGLNNGKASFLGLYAQDNRLMIQAIGIDGSTLYQGHIPFDNFLVEETIFTAIRGSLAEYPQIRGIGIAIKGIVYSDGTIHSHKRHDQSGGEGFWNFTGLSDKLTLAFPDLLFAVENDANCAAVQYHHGTGRENENLVVYLLNSHPFGLGCGILTGGSLYRGATGAAGEFFEKSSRLRELAYSLEEKDGFVSRFIPAILPHILQTAWLMDPHELVLAGSYVDGLRPGEIQAVEKIFENAQIPVKVKVGIGALDPARGAALLVTDSYVTGFIEEVKKR